MPAATNKSELLAVTEKDWTKLHRLFDKVNSELALRKDDDETSIKDVIAHRAHWIDLFLGWYNDGAAGKAVYFPAKGYKWNDLNRYNKALRERQIDLKWVDARTLLEHAHRELTDFIEATGDADLYAAPMRGANNKWPAGRWAEAAGPSHYRSAAKYLRARLKQAPT